MFENSDLLVIDWRAAGQLPQPFEHRHRDNVVVFPNHVELRQCQQLELGMTKYVIHTERFDGPPGQEIVINRFMEAFMRARRTDPVDLRKAIRWALKGSFAPPSVV